MKKTIIIVAILSVIVSGILLLIILTNSNSGMDSEMDEMLKRQEEAYLNGLKNPGLVIQGEVPKRVTNNNIFFTVEQCVNNYIKYVNSNDTKAVFSLLDYKYINDKKITQDNVNEYIIKYSKDDISQTIDMYEMAGIKYYTYYVEHRLGKNKVYFIVNTDTSSNAFSIVPIDNEEYNKKIKEKVQAFGSKEDIVEKNDYNTILYKYYTEEDIANKYFQDYLEKALYNPEEAFNSLDEQYRKEKFGNLEGYKSYIENNKSKLEPMCSKARKKYEDFENYQEYEKYYAKVARNGLAKYQIANEDEYKQYTCIDTNGCYYIFKVTSIMKYTLILDTYTIDLPEFTEKYNKASAEDKVLMNIQRFIDSIEDEDYRYAYNKLDTTFKNNNFKTQAEFESYVKKNFFKKNSLATSKAEKQGDVYLYNVTISDGSGKDTKSITKSFVMQLKEGTDFVMSFSVK